MISANRRLLKYSLMPGRFSVCRLPAGERIPDWAVRNGFHSVTRTSDELSIVCPGENVPSGVRADGRWICLKLAGPFPFSEVGVLASFVGPLAEHGIPIFVVATFDTDYVLIKEECIGWAQEVLTEAGHQLLAD